MNRAHDDDTEFYKPEKGRDLHPKQHRPITHREAARLQAFPDDDLDSRSGPPLESDPAHLSQQPL